MGTSPSALSTKDIDSVWEKYGKSSDLITEKQAHKFLKKLAGSKKLKINKELEKVVMNDCGIYADQGRMFDKRSFVLFVGKYGMLLNCPMTLSLEERIDQREGNSQPKNSVSSAPVIGDLKKDGGGEEEEEGARRKPSEEEEEGGGRKNVVLREERKEKKEEEKEEEEEEEEKSDGPVESKPQAGKLLREPNWQKPSDFPLPHQQRHSSRDEDGEWMWPKVDEEMKKRLENVSDERWGERKDGGKKIQCNICLEVYGMEKFHPFPGCAHRPYCSECVGRSIREDLHGKGQTTMKCTALNCKVDVDPYDVQRCCSRSDYERFCSLSTKRMLEKMEDFRFCTNHKNGCGSGQLHDGGPKGIYNVVMCHFCGWATCFIHKEQMHYGLTCEEYDSWKEASRALAALGYDADEEELTQALLRSKARRCPECKTLLTKEGTFQEDKEDEACDHMTCNCGAEFCWRCGGLFYGGDPTKRDKVRKCTDPKHIVNLRGHGSTLLHCHHKPGCSRA